MECARNWSCLKKLVASFDSVEESFDSIITLLAQLARREFGLLFDESGCSGNTVLILPFTCEACGSVHKHNHLIAGNWLKVILRRHWITQLNSLRFVRYLAIILPVILQDLRTSIRGGSTHTGKN
jgi:hypothetical protein